MRYKTKDRITNNFHRQQFLRDARQFPAAVNSGVYGPRRHETHLYFPLSSLPSCPLHKLGKSRFRCGIVTSWYRRQAIRRKPSNRGTQRNNVTVSIHVRQHSLKREQKTPYVSIESGIPVFDGILSQADGHIWWYSRCVYQAVGTSMNR